MSRYQLDLFLPFFFCFFFAFLLFCLRVEPSESFWQLFWLKIKKPKPEVRLIKSIGKCFQLFSQRNLSILFLWNFGNISSDLFLFILVFFHLRNSYLFEVEKNQLDVLFIQFYTISACHVDNALVYNCKIQLMNIFTT